MIYGVTIVYVIIIIVQFLKLKGQKSKKELVIAIFLTLIAMVYTYAYLMNWKLPTLDTVITSMFNQPSEKVFGAHHNY